MFATGRGFDPPLMDSLVYMLTFAKICHVKEQKIIRQLLETVKKQ